MLKEQFDDLRHLRCSNPKTWKAQVGTTQLTLVHKVLTEDKAFVVGVRH